MNPVTERLLTLLRKKGRRRIYLGELWEPYFAANPEATFTTDSRSQLGLALQEAASAGFLALSIGLDKSEKPYLPKLVTLAPDPGGPQLDRAARIAVWPPELAWAARMPLRREERDFLEAVRLFLRDLCPDEPVVPLRERSLQLTGDEKLIERQFLGRRLFAPGRLTLELLRARRVHPPFVWQAVDQEPTLLAVENHHTYHTLCQALTPEDGIGMVAYGYGRQFPSSVLFVTELPQTVTRILYYGDLDLEGLEIALETARAARKAGLPPVEPAAGLYRLLLEVGRPGPETGRRVTEPAARRACAWLPEDIRPVALQLLMNEQRMAQEGLGLRLLLDPSIRRRAFGHYGS